MIAKRSSSFDEESGIAATRQKLDHLVETGEDEMADSAVALDLMRMALALLDRDGRSDAGAWLQHAIDVAATPLEQPSGTLARFRSGVDDD